MLFLVILVLIPLTPSPNVNGIAPRNQLHVPTVLPESHVSSQQPIRLIYRLSLNQSSADAGLVPVTISFAPSYSSTSFTMSPVGGWYDPIEVRDFTVMDSKGAELRFQYRREASNQQSWTITMNEVSNITVHYTVYLRYFDPKTGAGGAYLGYLGSTFLLSGAGWIFLHPEGYSGSFEALFDLPPGWTAAVPWNRAGAGYVWSIGSDFPRSVVGLGTFRTTTVSLAGSNLTVAVHSAFSSSDSAQILAFTQKAFPYVADLFGGSPLPSYVSVWVPKPNGNRIDFIETYNGAGEAIDGFGMNMMYSFLHRLVHTFNGFQPTGMGSQSDSERWFVEGCDVYYDSKIPYVFGYQHDLNWLIDYLRDYDGYYGTQSDGAVSTTEPFSDRVLTLAYGKGSLVCFMLDSLIMRTTGGMRSLAGIMRRMYHQYGNYHGYYSTNDIQQIASEVSGFDMSKFFKLYIWGTSKLPVVFSMPSGVDVDWNQMQSDIGSIPGQPVTISQETTSSRTEVTREQSAMLSSTYVSQTQSSFGSTSAVSTSVTKATTPSLPFIDIVTIAGALVIVAISLLIIRKRKAKRA